jgi:hypothetical protein
MSGTSSTVAAQMENFGVIKAMSYRNDERANKSFFSLRVDAGRENVFGLLMSLKCSSDSAMR